MSLPRISILGLSEEGQKLQNAFNSVLSHIESGGIDSQCLAPGAVVRQKIEQYTIQGDQLADAAVESANIGTAQIQTAHIQDAAITDAKIGDAEIGNAKITDLSADKLTAGTIRTLDITIEGPSGHFRIVGNLQTMNDGSIDRVKFGDINGDGTLFNLEIYNEANVKLFDAVNGITADGIPIGIVDTEKLKDGTFTRTWKLNVDPDDANKQLWFGWLGDGYGIGYTTDDGATFVARNDGTGGYTDLTVTETLNIMGTIRKGANTNIDLYQPGISITVDQTAVADNVTVFNTITGARDSLNKRLTGDVTITLAAQTFTEDVDFSGFCGVGNLTFALTGGATRTIIEGTFTFLDNTVPIFITGSYTTDNDPTKQPGFIAKTAQFAVTITNCFVSMSRIFVKATGAAGSRCILVQSRSSLFIENSCIENAPNGSYALQARWGANVFAINCRGTNAGFGMLAQLGAYVQRNGTAINGTQGATAGSTAYKFEDIGTITPTNGASTTSAGTNTVLSCNPAESRSYFAYNAAIDGDLIMGSFSDTWAPTTAVMQGRSQLSGGNYSGNIYGAMLFGSGVGTPTALAGKTLVSARLRLTRYSNTGVSGAVPLVVYRCPLTDIPDANAKSPNASVSGSAVSLGSLAWGETKWFDIPTSLVAYLVAGESLALYTGTANYAKFYGIEGTSAQKPLLEITYVP